jgi:hypothetical protein
VLLVLCHLLLVLCLLRLQLQLARLGLKALHLHGEMRNSMTKRGVIVRSTDQDSNSRA